MNEQDLMIQEKIKKREKVDIMLAYFMLVVLLGSMIFMLYLKFIKTGNAIVENDNDNTEYTVNNIKIDDITNSLNDNLNAKYTGIVSSNSDNVITVNYGDIEYVINVNGNELVYELDNDNKELSEDIYKEIIAIICTFYNNDRTGCVNASKKVNSDTSINGVRFADNKVYIDIVTGINPSTIENNNDDDSINSDNVSTNNDDVVE